MSSNVIWPNYFGRKYLGSIRGFSMTLTVIGSAFGTLSFAIFYDSLGSYTEIIWIMMIFPALGGMAAFMAKPPKKHKKKAEKDLIKSFSAF